MCCGGSRRDRRSPCRDHASTGAVAVSSLAGSATGSLWRTVGDGWHDPCKDYGGHACCHGIRNHNPFQPLLPNDQQVIDTPQQHHHLGNECSCIAACLLLHPPQTNVWTEPLPLDWIPQCIPILIWLWVLNRLRKYWHPLLRAVHRNHRAIFVVWDCTGQWPL